jgi:putative redox protein
MTIHSETIAAGHFAQQMGLGPHQLRADVAPALGGEATGPGPHELFDAALAACKTLTAHWYAKQKNLPLERVTVDVTRDDSQERQGVYKLSVKVEFFGPLSPEQRQALYNAVGKCPVHKLMTTTDVQIETAPLE